MFNPTVTQFLQECVIPLRLSCLTPSGWPVMLSLWFLPENGRFYWATSNKAEAAIILDPINLFVWDFTARMRDSLPSKLH